MKYKVLLALLVALTACNGQDETKDLKKIEKQNEVEKTEVSTGGEKEIETEKIDFQKVKPEEQNLEIVNISTRNGENPSIDLEFNEDIQSEYIESYIEISPKVNVRVIKMKNHIILTGNFDINKKYDIKVLKGIKGKNGTLQADHNLIAVFKEIAPKIVFSNNGIILPKMNRNNISFRTVNVSKVKLRLRQVYLNNTTQFLQNFKFSGNGNLDSYYMNSTLEKVSDVILEKTFDLDTEKNAWLQTQINLSKYIADKGTYIVELSFDENGVNYTFPEDITDWKRDEFFQQNGVISKAVLVTDMGMIAQKEKDGSIVVNVMDVVKNEPVSGAKVKAMSYTNQVIEEKTTDKNGVVKFEDLDKLFYFFAENKNENSILKLSDSELSYDGFAVDGVYKKSDVEAFIYSSRGVYRPGDKVNVGIIARNKGGKYPENQPITIDVFTPTGEKYIDNKVIKENKDGFFTYEFETSKDDKTGLWTVVAYIGGEKFSLNLPIESIVAHKIEVKTNFAKSVDLIKNGNVYGAEVDGDIASKYLFGTPASDLKFTSKIVLEEKKISFPEYKGITFNNPTDYIADISGSYKGELDKDGKADFKFKIENLPKNITFKGRVITKIIQNSGRPVIKTNVLTVNPLDTYVGIQKLESGFIKTGEKMNLNILALDRDGKMASGRKIKYRIYKNEYSWWWDYYSYNQFIKSIKTDKNTSLIYEDEFVSTDKPYLLDYEVDSFGEYFVEVEDTKTHQSAGTTLYASTWEEPNNRKGIDKLKIETDKKRYKINEKAQVIFEGDKDTKALITVSSNGKILKRYWEDVKDIKNTVEIDVTKDMFPNAYVSVALFQKYGDNKNDRPLRLYGAVPVMIDNSEHKLDIGIETKDVLRPNEKFKVKVVNKSNGIMNYTMSVVDEGLLNINNFKTPNPYDYFYQKLGLNIDTYDNYSDIIGLPNGKVHQILTPGGGMMARAELSGAKLNELGFKKSDRFKPLSIFKGVRTTASDGIDEVEVTLPNYNGQVRVMVTGASGDKYGMAEKKIIVKSDIIANLSMPRVLKIGDKFEVPVTVFALENLKDSINVKFEFLGKTQEKEIKLQKDESKKIYFDVDVNEGLGNKEATLEISSGDFKQKQVVNIDVSSDTPYTMINELKTLKDGKLELEIPKQSIKDSVSGNVIISTTPILGIDNRISEIMRYPYGCLEQIVSIAVPQLFIENLTDSKELKKQEVVKNVNATIKRLANYQLDNGGFSYWPKGEKVSYWATTYVGEFLILAKEKGYYVSDGMYNSWLNFAKSLVRDDNVTSGLKAYTLYVLSLTNSTNISELNYIYDNDFKNLSTISKWFVAGTYFNIGEENMARKIAKNLSIEPKEIKGELYNFGSPTRDKAIILNIYNRIFDKVEDSLYSDILNKLRGDLYMSTQDIGYSMLAIGNIKSNYESKPLNAKIIVNGEEKAIDEANGKYVLELNGDIKDVEIVGENLFINEFWEGIPVKYDRKDSSSYLKLERHFYDEKGNEIDPKSMNVGSSFYMELKVNPIDNKEYSSVENVALTQILPSGWEIENTRMLNIKMPKWAEDKMDDNGLEYLDLRDDRVNIFYTFYNWKLTGQSFIVKLNAVTKGQYRVSGALTEGMYEPNYSSYLSGFGVVVE